MPSVGRTISAKLLPKMDSPGANVGALAERWTEIVGPRLGALSRPVRIVKGRSGRVLVIEAPSAAAPMIQHQSGIIIQRAQLGGAGQIKALRVQQTKTAPKIGPRAKSMPKPRQLSPARKQELEAYLADVQDEDIRAALFRLGEAILTRR